MEHLKQSKIGIIDQLLLQGATQVHYINSKSSKEKPVQQQFYIQGLHMKNKQFITAVNELENKSWFCYSEKLFNKYIEKKIEDERKIEVAKLSNDDNRTIDFLRLDFGQLTAVPGKVNSLKPQSTINNMTTSSIISNLIP